ncbi:MAG: ATP-dependent nuclease [Terracidiphilus sp.]
MQPRVWIETVTFSDGSKISFAENDVVIIVGPNNSGKSAMLRGINDKLYDSDASSFVVVEISIGLEGSTNEVRAWIQRTSKRTESGPGTVIYRTVGGGITEDGISNVWGPKRKFISGLRGFFCHLLTADERLTAANPPESIAITTDPPSHPIHIVQWNDSIEEKISKQFKRAFGFDLVVHRNAGRKVPILVGKKPDIPPGKDRVSIEYISELEKLPAVHTQGDGMRSFLGVLLFTTVGESSILLVDEPEAFLHPPQARHLGDVLVSETGSDHQLFVATHSGDVLRGVLDSDDPRVRVLRLRREGNKNIASQLKNSQISLVWSDPLLRYSNILDGLFHERVVVCESDSDCRFYSAITDAIFESGGDRRPDIMFTHCGGKQRLPLIIRSLRGLEVPISIVTDFDVLNAESPLMEIVEAAGGQWKDVKPDWKVVKKAIDDKKPELSTGEVRREIESALNAVTGHVIPEATKKTIQDALRASSPWSTAKSVGIAFVPSGDASQAAKNLMNTLECIGIFVVPVGELEGFLRTESGHGPTWVANALKRNLRTDPELEDAKRFIRKIIR